MSQQNINIECKNCSSYNQGAFNSLETSELDRLSNCKCSFFLKKGTVIFEEGEMLNGVYCIKEGVCKLTKLSPNGKNHIVRFAQKGDILGQKSVLSHEPTNLTATVLKDMRACFIPKEQLLTSLAENPNFSIEIAKNIYKDLRKADNFIVDIAQKCVKQRLADALLYLQQNFGEDIDGNIDIQLSREDIANMVGTATESLIRTLSEFSKNKIIYTKAKQIKILDMSKLQRISKGL